MPRTEGSEKSVVSLCFGSAHRYTADKTRHIFSVIHFYLIISMSTSSSTILIRYRPGSTFITPESLEQTLVVDLSLASTAFSANPAFLANPALLAYTASYLYSIVSAQHPAYMASCLHGIRDSTASVTPGHRDFRSPRLQVTVTPSHRDSKSP